LLVSDKRDSSDGHGRNQKYDIEGGAWLTTDTFYGRISSETQMRQVFAGICQDVERQLAACSERIVQAAGYLTSPRSPMRSRKTKQGGGHVHFDYAELVDLPFARH
jgi:hypothetical protein